MLPLLYVKADVFVCILFVQDEYKKYSRDPQRTPMQWHGGAAAGFTTGDPWLPLAADAGQRNVQVNPRLIILHGAVLK